MLISCGGTTKPGSGWVGIFEVYVINNPSVTIAVGAVVVENQGGGGTATLLASGTTTPAPNAGGVHATALNVRLFWVQDGGTTFTPNHFGPAPTTWDATTGAYTLQGVSTYPQGETATGTIIRGEVTYTVNGFQATNAQQHTLGQ